MISNIRYFMGSILLGMVLLSSTQVTAQSDFLFIIDNSGSISPAEFDQFVEIITATGNALDSDCPNSEFAVVHYGGDFGQETFIHNDFMPFAMSNPITRQYFPCVDPGGGPVAPMGQCGDDLPNAFGDVSTYFNNNALNPTPGNDLIVVIFTDADGMSQGMNNVSPCAFPSCSTLLPMNNFNSFVASMPMVSSYVVGVEATDNLGLLTPYLFGDGVYLPIDFNDNPAVAGTAISDEINCSTTMFNDCGPFTVEFTAQPIQGMTCYYLLTDLNNIILQFNANEPTFAAPPLGTYYTYIWCTDDPMAIPQIGQNATMIPVNGTFDLSLPVLVLITECPVIGMAKDLIDVADNGNNTYKVSYAFTVENFTSLTYTDIEIFDDIVTRFASLSPTNFMVIDGSLTGNAGWDGSASSNIVNDTETIGPLAIETISVSFDISPDYVTTNVDNNAFLNVTDPDDDVVSDTSTDGTDPDGTNDDMNPDEEEPTPTPIPNPPGQIGLAKDLIDVSDNGNGTYEVSYLFTIENFSPFALSNISLTDDILTPFAALNPTNFNTVSGSFNGSPFWNGSAGSNILLPGQVLPIDGIRTVSVTFDITPDGVTTNVDNTATVTGVEPDNDTVSDVSHDGLNPDPDDNDDPDEDDPTPTPIPVPDGAIGLAKDLIAVTDNGNGTFQVSFAFTVENFSPFALTNITIYDDLIAQFAGFSPSNFNTIDGSLTGSATWDGSSTSNVLSPGQSLAIDASETVSVSFDIIPDYVTTEVLNTATAEGTEPDQEIVTDVSTDGINPDPNNNMIPDEDDPTPVPLPLPDNGEISGEVFLDVNYNGLQEIGDNGLSGLLVQLLDCNGQFVAATNTDGQGMYMFEDVSEGFYQIQFSTPNNSYFYTQQDQGNDPSIDSDANSDGFITCFYMPGGASFEDFDAGVVQYATIGDYVFEDNNGNGVNNFEPGIPNVDVVLIDVATGDISAVTTTNGGGFYSFNNVLPGDYYISFDAPGEFNPTIALAGFDMTRDSDLDGSNGPGTTRSFSVISGETQNSIDAGYYECISIGEFTWYDGNKNDRKESYENGINGLLIELYRRENNVWSVYDSQYSGHKPGTPSDDGYFKFCVPPGTYYVQVNIPPIGLVAARKDAFGYSPLSNPFEQDFDSDINSSGRTDQIVVSSGQAICNIGAGFYPMATVGNRVWNDLNGDGIQSDGEPPMGDIKVEAYNIYGDMVGETTTDLAGEYMIDYLGQEDYYLRFTPRSGYAATVSNNGQELMDSDVDHTNGPNTTSFISMSSGDEIISVDAGMFLGVVPLEWLSVDASRKDDYHLIEWQTTNERNVSHYEVERNVGKGFVKIGQAIAQNEANATQSYAIHDNEIGFHSDFYYRIKGVDHDGSIDYSRTMTLRNSQEGKDIFVYPNPTTSMVFVETAAQGNINIKLFDVNGLLLQETMKIDTEMVEINLENYPDGVYHLQTTIGDTTTITKVVKL